MIRVASAFPLAFALVAALAGTACAPAPELAEPATVEGHAPKTAESATVGVDAPDTAEPVTVGGDGSEITLAPLTAADIDGASLAGELACSFSAGSGETPLLLAKGDVASDTPSRGVVKVGSHVEPVAAPGGFDGMLHGARFSGAGKVVVIEITGPATGDGESPPNPATLTYDRADGARRTFAGQWQCGP